MDFLDVVDAFNVPARLEAVLGAIIRKRGAAAVKVDRKNTTWSGADAQEFLEARGVRVWAGRTSGREFVMYVSPEQHLEAYGHLMGAGVALNGIPQGAKPITFGSLWKGGDASTGVPKGQAADTSAKPTSAPTAKTKRQPQKKQPSAAKRTVNQIRRWI